MVRVYLSIEQEDIIRDLYANTRTDAIAQALGLSITTIYKKANAMGLKKSREFLSTEASGRHNLIETGKNTRFEKGHTPFNKGLKGLYTIWNKGQFSKDHLPHNTKFDGAITIRSDHGKTTYKNIRLAKGKWQLYHRYLWEKHNGSIPEGMIVVFKDGNSMNCQLDNLNLITRAQHVRNNHNVKKIRERFKNNPDLWYTTTRLSKFSGLPVELITGEIKENIIRTMKLKRIIGHAKFERSLTNAE